MGLWIRENLSCILTPIELVELRNPMRMAPYPPQAISSVGVSSLTDTFRWRYATVAYRWLSRSIEKIASKLRVRSVLSICSGKPTMSSSRKSGIDGMVSLPANRISEQFPRRGWESENARLVKGRLGPLEHLNQATSVGMNPSKNRQGSK
jgi:hypothetical protein